MIRNITPGFLHALSFGNKSVYVFVTLTADFHDVERESRTMLSMSASRVFSSNPHYATPLTVFRDEELTLNRHSARLLHSAFTTSHSERPA